MQYRHEIKYCISEVDKLVLLSRLNGICQKDIHAVNGSYRITSLYFDDADDKALLENLSGSAKREKYRLRYYNDDTEHVFLEKKCKEGELGYKLQAPISKDDVADIINNHYHRLSKSDEQLIQELYQKMNFDSLHPVRVVQYKRYPFVFEAGNVRITIDEDIRTMGNINNFINPNAPSMLLGGECVLEVKWDQYLPDIIKLLIGQPGLTAMPFSKYVHARMVE